VEAQGNNWTNPSDEVSHSKPARLLPLHLSIIDNNQQNAPLLGLIFRLISTMTAMQSDVLILYQYRWLMGALKNYR
jgi:hypothetical protein